MADIGLKIEGSPVGVGATAKGKIIAASEPLGAAIVGPKADDKDQYLPEVTNPKQLVFALLYYQHISRYSNINVSEARWGLGGTVLSGVKGEQARVDANIIELQNRINRYLTPENFAAFQAAFTPEQQQAFEAAFPHIADKEGANFYQKAGKWVNPGAPALDNVVEEVREAGAHAQENMEVEPVVEANSSALDAEIIQQEPEPEIPAIKRSIEDKIIEQLNLGAKEIVEDSQKITELFVELEGFLQAKEATLRHVAAYKKLIELLSNGTLSVDDLLDIQVLKEKTPDFPEDWQKDWYNLNQSTPQTLVAAQANQTPPTSFVQEGASLLKEGVMMNLDFVLGHVGGLVSGGLGWFGIAAVDRGLELVSSWTSAAKMALMPANPEEVPIPANSEEVLIPVSAKDLRKEALIQAAKDNMTFLINGFNDKGELNSVTKVSTEDFKDMSSEQILKLGDKVNLIQKLVHVQLSLTKFLEVHGDKSLQNESSFTGKALKWFSANCKFIVSKNVLMTAEVQQLEKRVAGLVEKAKGATADGLDKKAILDELSTLLMQPRTSYARHGFFTSKKEQKATEALHEIVEQNRPK